MAKMKTNKGSSQLLDVDWSVISVSSIRMVFDELICQLMGVNRPLERWRGADVNDVYRRYSTAALGNNSNGFPIKGVIYDMLCFIQRTPSNTISPIASSSVSDGGRDWSNLIPAFTNSSTITSTDSCPPVVTASEVVQRLGVQNLPGLQDRILTERKETLAKKQMLEEVMGRGDSVRDMYMEKIRAKKMMAQARRERERFSINTDTDAYTAQSSLSQKSWSITRSSPALVRYLEYKLFVSWFQPPMAPKREDSSHTVTMSRPLSQSEENWARITDQGTGIASCGIALRRYVEENQISKALNELMEHYAIARSQIVENNKGRLYLHVNNSPMKPTVKEKSWPNIDHSISHPGVLELQNDDENHTLSLALNQIVCTEINIPFLNINKIAAPPLDVLQVHFYRNSSMPQTIIVIRIHSGACDRNSCCVMVKHFLTALNAIVEGRKPEFPDNPGKNELPTPMEDMIPKGKADKGFLTKGLDVLGYALDSKKYSLLPFNPEFTKMSNNYRFEFVSDIVTYNLGREGTSTLYDACKQENTTLTAALASAYLQTASNIKELKEKKLNQFCFTGVLDCRPYFEPPLAENALGNYSAGILQGVQVKNDISFWDLARSISSKTEKEIRKHKHFSELPVLAMLVRQVMKHPSLTPSSSKRSGLFTMFLGEAGKIEWKNVDSLNVAGSLGPVASMHAMGPCFCACESLREGPDLCISFIFATPVFTKDQMHCFATSVFQLLTLVTSSNNC